MLLKKKVYGVFFPIWCYWTESPVLQSTEDRLLDVFQMYLCEFASFVPSCSSGWTLPMKSKCGLILIQAGKNSVLSSFLCLTFLIVHGCHIHRVAFLPSLKALQDPFIVGAFQSLVHNPHQQQNKHPNKKKTTKIGAAEDAVIQTDRYCCKYQNYFCTASQSCVGIQLLILLT